MRLLGKKLVVIFAFATIFSGCDGADELINFFNCTFEVQEVEEFTFAGVHFDQLDSLEDISDADMAKINQAVEEKDAQASFVLTVIATNPNDVTASVETLSWILEVDKMKVAEGVITEKFTIPAKNSNTLSLPVSANMTKAYSDSTIVEDVYQLYRDISNGSTPNVTVKIKPTINKMEFQDYIELKYAIKNEE